MKLRIRFVSLLALVGLLGAGSLAFAALLAWPPALAVAATAADPQLRIWELETQAATQKQLDEFQQEIAKLRNELAEERGKREGISKLVEAIDTHYVRIVGIIIAAFLILAWILTWLGKDVVKKWIENIVKETTQPLAESSIQEAQEKAKKEIETFVNAQRIRFDNLRTELGEKTEGSKDIEQSKKELTIWQAFMNAKGDKEPTANDLLVLANLLYENNDFDQAIELYDKVVKAQPNNATAHFNLAFSYDKIGKTIQAIEHYSLAIKLKPDYAKAYNNRGLLYAKNPKTWDRSSSIRIIPKPTSTGGICF